METHESETLRMRLTVASGELLRTRGLTHELPEVREAIERILTELSEIRTTIHPDAR